MFNDEDQTPPIPQKHSADLMTDQIGTLAEKSADAAKLDEEGGVDKVASLTSRYLEICLSIYPVAVSNHDIKLASQIAKSALSIVINAANQLGKSSAQQLALNWFARLASLYTGGEPIPGDVSRTLRWASSAMIYVFGQDIQTPGEAEEE
jgi:hypothetical protein